MPETMNAAIQTTTKIKSVRRIIFMPPACIHRAVENRPLAGTSKPATPRCIIHIKFLDSGKRFPFILARSRGSFGRLSTDEDA